MKIEYLISQKEAQLSLTEKKICAYLIQNKHKIANMTLNEIKFSIYGIPWKPVTM
jgi:DNA-binding MurR/RpiR family transcriptional regulator